MVQVMTDTVNHMHSSEERLSRLEATVETFVLTVSRDIQEQNQSITLLRQAIQDQNKTPWHNYIAGFAVLLVILAMFGNGYVRDLNRMENDLLDTQADYHNHSSDGHPELALREMKLYRDVDHEHMKTLQDDILELQEWRRNAVSDNAAAHATLSADVDNLRRAEERAWAISHGGDARVHGE